MIIRFTLNEKEVTVEANPEERLIEILRNHFGFIGTKVGCYRGQCGTCSILLNGELTLSCMIPAFAVRGKEVVTIESFSQTKEFKDIMNGFRKAGLEVCGFCAPGKVFATHALIERVPAPTDEEIIDGLSGNACRCTGYTALIQGVKEAALFRKRRYGKKI